MVALFALKIALGLFGLMVGLAVTVVVFAAIGYGGYLVLRVLSPGTAVKLRRLIQRPSSGEGAVSPPQRPRTP